MIQGFNHNVRYGGRVFHVQTEDSGLANPHIVTHLYHGGIIVASRKTSYADIITSDRRDEVIREIMKEQHRQMLLDLRDGRLDANLAAFNLAPGKEAPSASKRSLGFAEAERGGAGYPAERPGVIGRADGAPMRGAVGPSGAPADGGGPGEAGTPTPKESLDDVILDYLASRTTPREPRKP